MMFGFLKSSSKDPADPVKDKPSSESDVITSLNPSLQQFYATATPRTAASKVTSSYSEEIANVNGSGDTSQASHGSPVVVNAVPPSEILQTTWEAANENCAELSVKVGNCLRYGGFWQVLSSCQTLSNQHQKCLKLQQRALNDLGHKTAGTNQERNQIKFRVDDLWMKNVPDNEITEQAEKDFTGAVLREHNERSIRL